MHEGKFILSEGEGGRSKNGWPIKGVAWKCHGQAKCVSKSARTRVKKEKKKKKGRMGEGKTMFPGDLWKTNNCHRCQSQTSLVESSRDGHCLRVASWWKSVDLFRRPLSPARLSRARLIFKRIEVYLLLACLSFFSPLGKRIPDPFPGEEKFKIESSLLLFWIKPKTILEIKSGKNNSRISFHCSFISKNFRSNIFSFPLAFPKI